MRKTRHEIVHEYELTEGEVPDLQDTSQSRSYVVRPRKVTIYQIPGTDLARGAVVEGRQVRRDGGFNRRSTGRILVGCSQWYDAAPPAWLNELLDQLNLNWYAGEPAVAR